MKKGKEETRKRGKKKEIRQEGRKERKENTQNVVSCSSYDASVQGRTVNSRVLGITSRKKPQRDKSKVRERDGEREGEGEKGR